MTEYPEHTIYNPKGDVYYVPFIASDGRVGYRVGRTDSRPDVESFVYLNPSTEVDLADGSDGGSDVFLYEGLENDPMLDRTVVFVRTDLEAVLGMAAE